MIYDTAHTRDGCSNELVPMEVLNEDPIGVPALNLDFRILRGVPFIVKTYALLELRIKSVFLHLSSANLIPGASLVISLVNYAVRIRFIWPIVIYKTRCLDVQAQPDACPPIVYWMVWSIGSAWSVDLSKCFIVALNRVRSGLRRIQL